MHKLDWKSKVVIHPDIDDWLLDLKYWVYGNWFGYMGLWP